MPLLHRSTKSSNFMSLLEGPIPGKPEFAWELNVLAQVLQAPGVQNAILAATLKEFSFLGPWTFRCPDSYGTPKTKEKRLGTSNREPQTYSQYPILLGPYWLYSWYVLKTALRAHISRPGLSARPVGLAPAMESGT